MKRLISILTVLLATSALMAGPYSPGNADTTGAIDSGVAGFVGPDGEGQCGASAPNNYVNPEFLGWATGYQNVVITDTNSLAYAGPTYFENGFIDPDKALGAVTGDHFDTVSLGDLDPDMLAAGDTPGQITLTFDTPIRNGVGADLAVFENGFYSQWTTGDGTVTGQIFAELAYVEVSTDGTNWLRFDGVSLTPTPSGSWAYLSMNSTDIYNLAGKHTNQNGQSWGTPFDLENFADDALVTSGDVDLNQIHFVRIVDIPGSGDFTDSLGNGIYDGWITAGSGGFDLEALGALNELPDFDGDGDVDGDDFDILAANLGSADLHYDLDNDGDADAADLAYMISTCLQWASASDDDYGTLAGDFNLDGAVDAGDLALLGGSFGQAGPFGWGSGDATGDTMVDAGDLALLGGTFGATVTPVPEPTSMSLLALAGVAVIRRRKA
jgi:hypothetical protein